MALDLALNSVVIEGERYVATRASKTKVGDEDSPTASRPSSWPSTPGF